MLIAMTVQVVHIVNRSLLAYYFEDILKSYGQPKTK